jgi:hypothetical protein
VVLEQSAGQGHLVGGLNQSSTEVLHAAVFILCHHVEGRGQELLSQSLGGGRCTPDLVLPLQLLQVLWVQDVIRRALTLPLGLSDYLYFLLEQKASDKVLNASGSQVLGSHRPGPGLLDDFLNQSNHQHGLTLWCNFFSFK